MIVIGDVFATEGDFDELLCERYRSSSQGWEKYEDLATQPQQQWPNHLSHWCAGDGLLFAVTVESSTGWVDIDQVPRAKDYSV